MLTNPYKRKRPTCSRETARTRGKDDAPAERGARRDRTPRCTARSARGRLGRARSTQPRSAPPAPEIEKCRARPRALSPAKGGTGRARARMGRGCSPQKERRRPPSALVSARAQTMQTKHLCDTYVETQLFAPGRTTERGLSRKKLHLHFSVEQVLRVVTIIHAVGNEPRHKVSFKTVVSGRNQTC